MNSLRACVAGVLLISLAGCGREDRAGGYSEPVAEVHQTDSADYGSATAARQDYGSATVTRQDSRSATVARIEPRDAKPRIDSGAALLVCAYDNPEKFRQNQLQGALSLNQLHGRESSLTKESEIIFYCACPADASAVRLATEYRDRGYINAKVLNGGVAAWKQAGYALVTEPG